MHLKKRIERLERVREARGARYTDEDILECGRNYGLPDDQIPEIWWRVVRGRFLSDDTQIDIVGAFSTAAHELGIEFVMTAEEVEAMRQELYEHWHEVGIKGREQSASEFLDDVDFPIVKSRAEYYAEIRNAHNPPHDTSDPAARK